METINKKRLAENILFILIGGIVLFICVNTNEAKKLIGYAVTVLSPFIYGFCIAFILNLVSKQFDKQFQKHSEKKGKPYRKKQFRVISIVLALLVFLLFAGLSIGLIIPNLKNTVVSLYKQAPELWNRLMDFLDKLKIKQPRLATYITTLENNIDLYYEKILNSLKSNISNIASSALSKIKSASNVVVNFSLGLIIAFGILTKKEALVKEFYALLHKLLPSQHFHRIKYVLELANKKFQIYFKYNLIQAVITGAGTLVFMLITGMPYKVSISLLITVTQLIPIVGAIVGTAVSALLIAAVSPVKAILFIVLCIVVQQLVEKLINPHLMGKELDMPGLLTFLAIIIGGKQFGLLGLICSVPFVSVIYDIYKIKLRPRIYQNKE